MLKVDFIKRRPGTRSVQVRFNFELEPGSIAFIAGSQGSGKSTVLQAICGNLRPDSGKLVFGNQIWYYGDGRQCLEFLDRSVVLVSGEGDLLDGRSVRWNVSSVLAHWPTQSRGQRITEVLARVGLESKVRMLVSSLDPEQRWRLLLAKAIASRPSLLLLDEPFKGFPPLQRQRLTQGLRTVLREEGIPGIVALPEVKDLFQPGESVLSIDSIASRRFGLLRSPAVA